MTRIFKANVQFDLTNEKIVNCLMANFNLDDMDDNGNITVFYKGNKKSTTQSVYKGIERSFGFFKGLKNEIGKGYHVTQIEEVTE